MIEEHWYDWPKQYFSDPRFPLTIDDHDVVLDGEVFEYQNGVTMMRSGDDGWIEYIPEPAQIVGDDIRRERVRGRVEIREREPQLDPLA